MKTSKFARTLSTYVGSERTKSYLDSAPMFLAKVHSDIVRGYWIESIQFEDSRGNLGEREYHLKCALGTPIRKVKTLKHQRTFFGELDITEEVESLFLALFMTLR